MKSHCLLACHCKSWLKAFLDLSYNCLFIYLKAVIRCPLSLFFSRLNNCNSLSLFSQARCSWLVLFCGPPLHPLWKVHVLLVLGTPIQEKSLLLISNTSWNMLHVTSPESTSYCSHQKQKWWFLNYS